MSLFSFGSMVMGVILTAVTGPICLLHDPVAVRHLENLPYSQLFVPHYAAALGLGLALVALSNLCRPIQFQ